MRILAHAYLMNKQISRLYIIGAGASFIYGLPTLKTLTWDLCEFLEQKDREIIKCAVYEAFNINLKQPKDSPDFEEFLNRLDARALLYLQGNDFDPRSTFRAQAAEIALKGLRDFIHNRCQLAADKIGPYDVLVQSLTEKDALVSFNWDVLLEIAFRRIGKNFIYLETEQSGDNTIFLKPHGSINWYALLDRELLSVDLNLNWDVLGRNLSYYMLFLKDPLGSRDLGESSPFVEVALSRVPAIIPPVASKMLSVGGRPVDGWVENGHERMMKECWSLFRKLVAQANELIVIGYSLPGTDSASIEVLKQFARNNDSLKTKRLMIIDKNPKIIERYRRLVHSNAKLICENFKDFDPKAV
jgi:hypothetical protein